MSFFTPSLLAEKKTSYLFLFISAQKVPTHLNGMTAHSRVTSIQTNFEIDFEEEETSLIV